MAPELRLVPLRQLAELTLSSVDKKTREGERGVSLCNYMDVYSNAFIRAEYAFMSATASEREIQKCGLRRGDVVITKDSESFDDIGVPALVRDDVENLVCGYHLAILRPLDAAIDSTYLYYALQSPAVQQQFHSFANGVTRFGLRKNDIQRVRVAVPERSTQRAVGHILGTLDEKIELNRRTNRMLEEMSSALFQDWFVNFGPVRAKSPCSVPQTSPAVWNLFPDRLVDSGLGEIPNGWKTEKLSKHISMRRGISYKGDGLCSQKEGLPMHNLNSIYEGGGYKHEGIKYYRGEFRENHLLKAGDLIVANTEQGFERLLIGHAAIIPHNFGWKGLFSHHLYRIGIRAESHLTPVYCCHLINEPQFHSRVSGFSNGSTINMLPSDALEIPEIVVPPSELVRRFTTIAGEVLIRIGLLVGEAQALTELRDTLLRKLISGEIPIPDAEKVVESVA